MEYNITKEDREFMKQPPFKVLAVVYPESKIDLLITGITREEIDYTIANDVREDALGIYIMEPKETIFYTGIRHIKKRVRQGKKQSTHLR